MGSGPSLPEGKERSRGQAERKAMTGNTSGIHVQAACLLFCVRRTHRVSAYKCVCLFSHSIALPHPKQATAREHSNPAPDNTHRAKGGQGIYIPPNEPFQAGRLGREGGRTPPTFGLFSCSGWRAGPPTIWCPCSTALLLVLLPSKRLSKVS